MPNWLRLDEFPQYLVSDFGMVRHETSQRDLTPLLNNTGIAFVSLTHRGKKYNRSLNRLVAQSFLAPPQFGTFDTPINLNGNPLNNRVTNLMWRPRWFAVKYHQQFDHPPKGVKIPIVDVETGERFPNSWAAAIKYGLLDAEILLQIMNNGRVFPTNQMFVLDR